MSTVSCLVVDLPPDGTRWVACRPGFFLPVRVRSRLFRRLFLKELRAAFAAGRLRFFGDLARLADHRPVRRAPRSAPTGRLGRLCQAAIRRARTGAGLSQPLYASRRHSQQSADLTRRWQGELFLEGLSAESQGATLRLIKKPAAIRSSNARSPLCPDFGGTMRRVEVVPRAHPFRCDTS